MLTPITPQKITRTYSELHQNIQDKFDETVVEIMCHHYSQLRDGNTATITENYRPENYVPPGLRIVQVDDKNPNK